MELRLAKINDLSQLKTMYYKIIEKMNFNNIKIWNEFYPYEIFKDDIEKENLYLIMKNDEIVAAFALYELDKVEKNLEWENSQAKAMYISHIGVNINYLRQGIGGLVIKNAKEISNQKGAKYLRLLVVDLNKPAINLYLKNGFRQVNGFTEEKINDNVILIEYGFEIDLTKSKV